MLHKKNNGSDSIRQKALLESCSLKRWKSLFFKMMKCFSQWHARPIQRAKTWSLNSTGCYPQLINCWTLHLNLIMYICWLIECKLKKQIIKVKLKANELLITKMSTFKKFSSQEELSVITMELGLQVLKTNWVQILALPLSAVRPEGSNFSVSQFFPHLWNGDNDRTYLPDKVVKRTKWVSVGKQLWAAPGMWPLLWKCLLSKNINKSNHWFFLAILLITQLSQEKTST